MLILQIFLCFLPIFLSLILFPFIIKSFNFKNAFFSVFIGFLTFIPIIIIHYLLYNIHFFTKNSIFNLFLFYLIFNGITEETIKMLFFYIHNKLFQKSVFFACCITSSLTLASFETFIYFLTGNTNIILRLFTAVIIHTICALFSAIYIEEKKSQISFSFFWAIMLHTLYNFFASLPDFFNFFSIIVIIFGIIKLIVKFLPNNEIS